MSRALSVLLLATALAGCPKGRTYVVRAYDPAGGKVLGSSVALGAPVTGASATWACPGDALPAEVAKNRAFKPQRDGSLVAAFYEDVAMDCAIELAVPGAGPVRVPVSEVCTEAHGAWCAGLEASVLVARSTGAGLAVVASAIPLDAPRPAGGEITTVLSVVVQADGQILVDGAKVDDAGLSAAATKATAAHPELRAVIKADRAVPHGTVVHVLDLLKQAGVGRIAFGVSPTAR